MKYIIIGLGNLGKALAQDLSRIGNDVIGVDINITRVDAMKQVISGAVCLDTTDEEALRTLPLKEADAIYVTFGKDFGASVQTVALLKSLGANKLIVRATSYIHETVIQAIGVTEVIRPEQDFSSIYVSHLLLGALFKQWYKITDTHHLFKIAPPAIFIGQSLQSINFQEKFNLRLVAVERLIEVKNILGVKRPAYQVIDDFADAFIIEKEDVLLLFGQLEDIRKIAEL